MEILLQRYGMDRRQKQAHPWFNIHCLRGRRRAYRRVADTNNPSLTLDWHQPHLLYITLAILFLCFVDAHNTLQLLQQGAEEANFFMDTLIRRSMVLFLAVKLGLTAVCMLVLVSYHHIMLFNLIRIRHVIYSIFGVYIGLIGYEIVIWPGPGVPFLLILTEEDHSAIISALLSLI